MPPKEEKEEPTNAWLRTLPPNVGRTLEEAQTMVGLYFRDIASIVQCHHCKKTFSVKGAFVTCPHCRRINIAVPQFELYPVREQDLRAKGLLDILEEQQRKKKERMRAQQKEEIQQEKSEEAPEKEGGGQ